jgi:hypothetical protein
MTSLSTTRPHTGSKSLEGTYDGDADDVSWWLKQGYSGSFTEIYVSFYDYQESQMKFNDELFLVDIGKFTPAYALQFQLTADYYGMGDGPPPEHTGFNSDYAYMVLVSNSVTGDGYATHGNYWWKQESTKGQWVQWEVHYRPNTVTNGVANFNGFYRLYKNGVLFSSVENDVLNDTTDWTQPYIQVGGVYTKIKWETYLGSGVCTTYIGAGWGDAQAGIEFDNCPCPNQCPPDGQVPIYKRFIDDVIIMKLTGAGGGYDAQPPYTTTHSPAKSTTGVPIGTTEATFSLKDDRADDEGTTLSTISMTGPDGTKTCSTGTPTLTCTGSASNYSITYPGLSLSYEELAQFTLTATDNAGNVLNESWSWTVALDPGGIPGGGADPPYTQSTYLTGLVWDNTGLSRKGPGSDMWPSTWASDDLIYTTWGDGGGLNGWNDVCRTKFGVQAITGTPTSFTANNLYGCKSDDTGCTDTEWSSHYSVCNASYASQFTTSDYGDGIIAIDNTMYVILSNQTPPVSSTIAHSENLSQTWTKYGWSWSRTSAGDWYPFGFVQFGKAYAGARDTYLYLVGGAMNDNVHTYLARVPNTEIGTQGSYEWYTSADPGSPTWGAWASRQPIFTDNNLSWVSGIYYFPVIDRYIITAAHGESVYGPGDIGKLGVFEAEEPWGPWYTVYYSDNWQGYAGDYALQFPIIQKWTSANNLDFYMAYSSSGALDSWNLFKGTFELTPFPTLTITTTTLVNATVGDSTPQNLSASGGQTPYTWSLLSGTLPTGRNLSPAGEITGSYTEAGTFNFTVQAQDAQANTDNQALSQVVVPATPTGQTTATITAIADTFIDFGTPGTNYSTNTTSITYQWPYGVVANRVLDNVSLSSLPANISITAASLEMYLTDYDGSGGTDPMRIYIGGLTGPVNISTVTWSNFDNGVLPAYNRYTYVTLVPGWFSFNVLEETQAAYAAGIPLYLALDGGTYGNQDTNRIFASIDHGTAAWRPRLKVTYTQLSGPPPSPSTPTSGKMKIKTGTKGRWRSFR